MGMQAHHVDPHGDHEHGGTATHPGHGIRGMEHALKEIPPLAWVLIVVGGYLVYKAVRGNSSNTAAAGSTAATTTTPPDLQPVTDQTGGMLGYVDSMQNQWTAEQQALQADYAQLVANQGQGTAGGGTVPQTPTAPSSPTFTSSPSPQFPVTTGPITATNPGPMPSMPVYTAPVTPPSYSPPIDQGVPPVQSIPSLPSSGSWTPAPYDPSAALGIIAQANNNAGNEFANVPPAPGLAMLQQQVAQNASYASGTSYPAYGNPPANQNYLISSGGITPIPSNAPSVVSYSPPTANPFTQAPIPTIQQQNSALNQLHPSYSQPTPVIGGSGGGGGGGGRISNYQL